MVIVERTDDKPVRMIVADASEDFRDLLIDRLCQERWVRIVGSTANGRELIALAQREKPDLVLSDIVLQEISGLTALRQVSQLDCKPVIVVMSAFLNERTLREACEAGATYFVQKPFDTADLLDQMQRLVAERPSSPAELALRRRNMSLEERVTELMHDIGVPAHIKGYNYVRCAIILATKDPEMINAVTKLLYPAVAKYFATTPSRVERAIRHAIEVAWDRGDIDTLQKHFGYTVSNAKGKPTNSEFIAMLADELRMKYYRDKTAIG